jgi:hypothetical protein
LAYHLAVYFVSVKRFSAALVILGAAHVGSAFFVGAAGSSFLAMTDVAHRRLWWWRPLSPGMVGWSASSKLVGLASIANFDGGRAHRHLWRGIRKAVTGELL